MLILFFENYVRTIKYFFLSPIQLPPLYNLVLSSHSNIFQWQGGIVTGWRRRRRQRRTLSILCIDEWICIFQYNWNASHIFQGLQVSQHECFYSQTCWTSCFARKKKFPFNVSFLPCYQVFLQPYVWPTEWRGISYLAMILEQILKHWEKSN